MHLSKKIFSSLILSFLSFTASAAPEIYKIDPGHSYVQWHISHFGFSNPSGKWMAEGTITVDEKQPQNAKVNVTIPVANIVTGIPKLDEHLQTEDFFNVAKFPVATFVSNKITLTGKDMANVQGILTLHGVSKPITLKVKLNKVGNSPISNKRTAGFTAESNLKRSEFGVNKYLPGLGDEVKLNIEVEAVQQKEATTDAT